MAGTAHSVYVATALVCGVVLAAACGGGDSDYEVTSAVVSDETTQDILVFEPQSRGSVARRLRLARDRRGRRGHDRDRHSTRG